MILYRLKGTYTNFWSKSTPYSPGIKKIPRWKFQFLLTPSLNRSMVNSYFSRTISPKKISGKNKNVVQFCSYKSHKYVTSFKCSNVRTISNLFPYVPTLNHCVLNYTEWEMSKTANDINVCKNSSYFIYFILLYFILFSLT